MDAPLPAPEAAGLSVGTTRVGGVLEALGPPTHLTATASGYAMVYEHNEITERALGFSVPESAFQYFKLAGAKAHLDHTCWILTFDHAGTLTGMGTEQFDNKFGGAAAVQIIVSEKSLVDTSTVTGPASQHHWGLSSLGRVPVVLNNPSSLATGASGLQQTLAPDAAGQHSLEMHNPPPRVPRKRQ